MTPEQRAKGVAEAIDKLGPDVKPGGSVWAAFIAEAIRDAEDALRLDAARYRWLRDENAYRPEEMSVTGGERLDKLCDHGLAGGNGDPDD
jgi:hypothetical protein